MAEANSLSEALEGAARRVGTRHGTRIKQVLAALAESEREAFLRALYDKDEYGNWRVPQKRLAEIMRDHGIVISEATISKYRRYGRGDW